MGLISWNEHHVPFGDVERRFIVRRHQRHRTLQDIYFMLPVMVVRRRRSARLDLEFGQDKTIRPVLGVNQLSMSGLLRTRLPDDLRGHSLSIRMIHLLSSLVRMNVLFINITASSFHVNSCRLTS
ncbi:hypothetical protein HMPREF0682_2974 [Propionibacterium acidifaciens F0233]|uniref:Uncharacterized protein n=1 Tax=Propionibacterium acidifaciens F0233 TaxID=553198 RepID=U2QBT9_9ACTN|nr:hypothetical protein HMPREF0682_2974 [Propionibacterium acidifaciens F0233]